MATTTNYGWTTPDDTALVKDGASAIRTLGTSVDTTTKNLNPETTLGDISFRSSTSNVNTRLGIGSTSQVLTVTGGVPVWATPAAGGGMTLLSTTTLSGASTTISSISGSYKSLVMYVFGITTASNGAIRIAPNAVTNLCSYTTSYGEGGSVFHSSSRDDYFMTQGNMLSSSANNAFVFVIDNYASATSFKPIRGNGYYTTATTTTSQMQGGAFKSNTAITSLEFSSSNGNLSAGTVLLYGVS